MKYFIVSDTHSFATSLKIALRKSGFRKRDKNHTLVICGDLFDRGNETLELYKFITSIPKKRRILIRGNHEDLYLGLLKKEQPDWHDFSNGTVSTFCQIADYDSPYWPNYEEWETIRDKVKSHPITKFLLNNEWKNYFEIGKYICVHSFIPLVDNWREKADAHQWFKARWVCPWKLVEFFKEEGKTIVCGHWNVSDFYKYLDNDDSGRDDTYISDKIIGLDAGVYIGPDGYYVHKQNVLVIDI